MRIRPALSLRIAAAALAAVLCTRPGSADDGGAKGSDAGGPPAQDAVHRPEFGVNPSELTDAEKEARFKIIQKEYEDLKRNQDVIPTRKRRNQIRFVGEMRYPPAAAWLETAFDTDRDNRAQCAAMVAVGQTDDVATIQSVTKKVIASAKKEPVFVLTLPRMYRETRNPEAGKWLAGRMEAQQSDVLASIVEAVGASGIKEATSDLEKMVDKAKDVVVKFEALRAYGHCGKTEAVSKLFNHLSDPDWRIRMGAAEGLRFAGEPRAIRELTRLIIEGEEPIVIETATEAVGELGLAGDGTADCVPPLLNALHAGRMRCREKARQYLKQVALKLFRQSRDFSTDYEAWKRWHDQVKNGFDADDPNYAKRQTSSFYRFSVASDKVLFILDISGSMLWPDGPKEIRTGDWTGRRIDMAHRELFKALNGLNPETWFNVETFSGGVTLWQKQEVLATRDNVAQGIEWIKKQLPRGGTASYDALDHGITKTNCDTIFFLSDGCPSAGKYDEPETILAELRKSNRFRRVTINTIALIVGKTPIESILKYEDPEEMAEFMSRVAEENFGGFQDESRP